MITLNKVETYPDKTVGSIIENGKTYYICNVCGRKSFRAIRMNKLMWCNKHYKQQKKYGHVMDDNPRTLQDRNEIRVKGDVAEMDLYDKQCRVIGTTIFDTEDVPKVRYVKWKKSGGGEVMNAPKYKSGRTYMDHIIIGVNVPVDHINHNMLDNRKSNLRIGTESQDTMNTNIKGVSIRNGSYTPHIKKDGRRLNLGVYANENDAYWARWYAEKVLFDGHRFSKPEPIIENYRKKEIANYVDRKVQRLPLSASLNQIAGEDVRNSLLP